MSDARDIQSFNENLKLEKITDGMYSFPEAQRESKEDFFKGLENPRVVGTATGVARAREVPRQEEIKPSWSR